jgi:hypothetical protein
MTGSVVKLCLAWVFLMAVAGAEFVVSSIHMAGVDRPVLFVFAIVMVTTIGFAFMHAARAPLTAHGFMVAAVFWLIILLGLSSMDILTRHLWWVHGYHPQ